MKKSTYQIAMLILAVGAGSGMAGYWVAQRAAGAQAMQVEPAKATTHVERKVLYWYDPMMPNQRFDKPGKSPFMDMQLIAKYADEQGDGAGVKIDSGISQNLGMRTAKVERGSFLSTVRAVANVQLNDRQVAIVQARSNGFVERVYARAPGDVIARGAPLVDLLIPEWAGAQAEFLAVLGTKDLALIQAARTRLQLLGMSGDLISRVEKSGRPQTVVTIAAPISGLIQTLDIRSGMTVSAGAPLARINGLDTVWLEAAIPEAQAALVNVGGKLEADFAAYSGEKFTGKILAVLPESNADSRTLRVRAELPNRDGKLKPGMYAQIRLGGGKAAPSLLVPSEAVIRTGARNILLVTTGDGRYQPVEVKLGQESDGKSIILDGVTEGQQVVTSGQFLIDSEASLKGVLARLNTSAGADAKSAQMPLNEATGKIESLRGTDITLSHGPVPTLGWGAMTMSFKLARPEMATGLKTGDSVHFGFQERNGDYVIEKLDRSTP
ncbi:efflux RND transporter periplasmic adaptor subunit [Herbaspirillum huttiense]|uniref:efflux RND transporter periplasmic adaptor subunit n=1 Tax=Herbaspirillum huttiense TaxID=863372 RepID=UPI00040F44C6|nr:efflux RND transporter periplasmic adaptor subunit [Herbaspirillum huttiense]